MAETLLAFGVEKLWDLLVRESERLQGVGEQFDELKSDMNMLRCFLEDADAKKHTSAMVSYTVKMIKEIVYDAEDIIETFLRKEELGRTSGIKKHIRQLACVLAHRRKIAFDMEVLHKRIANVIRDMQSLGVQQVMVNDGYMQSLRERQRQMRQTFSDNDESILVGLEENVKKLVGHLVEEERSQVVSITGMGGIGKTTLARQVFNHETVTSHFAGHAWVCVSQQFTRKDVWQTILRKVGPEYIKSEMTDDELQENIFRVLKTRKALIVLDDIWREEDWDIIKPIFPPGKGWKLLLTSRNEGVALRADPNCFTFKPDYLTLEESLTIFGRIVFPSENITEYKVDEEMEELGKKMVKRCGGLPLAVKVLGGLLVVKYTLNEWKRIYENIRSHIVGGTNLNDNNISSVYHILSLSFEELPIYLKQCFLYLAQFPEDFEIEVEKLSHYWAVEGIPRPRFYDGATVREVADGYIEELVKRNMVISERYMFDTSRFETCHMHDMMREVCLRKAEEENFVQIVDRAYSQSSCKSRRIAVHKTYHPNWEKQINPKLRSILFIKDSWRQGWKASGLCFTRLQLMRVLDLSHAKFEGRKLPYDIGKLIHLRYLNLYQAEVTHLPSSMRNLKLLLYLNLEVKDEYPLDVPNILKEMRELRYLFFPVIINVKKKLELGSLVNLETLERFSTENSREKDLRRMTKLRSLSIDIKGKGCNVETLSSSLSEMRQLEDLVIYAPKDDEIGFVLKCIHLKKMDLTIYMPRLPDEQHFPSHLTTIKLSGCRLEEDPMPILEKLLQLKEVRLLNQSFSGRRMVCSGGGFPQLQELVLWGLEEWDEWIVEEGLMPLLNTLHIYDCPKFKKLPDGQLLPSHLTTIYLERCGLEEDPMPILEKLLQLKTVHLNYQSFSGRRMVCSGGGFLQLHKLVLWNLDEWEEWIVEEGSMPLLHTLAIWDCPKLKELPDGLRFLYSLNDMTVDHHWKESLSEGGDDNYKVQHIPSVKFIEL